MQSAAGGPISPAPFQNERCPDVNLVRAIDPCRAVSAPRSDVVGVADANAPPDGQLAGRTTVLPLHRPRRVVGSSRPDVADVDRNLAVADTAGRGRPTSHNGRRGDPPPATSRISTGGGRLTCPGLRLDCRLLHTLIGMDRTKT